jgi:hypothetical protein
MCSRFSMLGLLAFAVAACDGSRTGTMPAGLAPSFQLVDLNLETHFRCYTVSRETPDTPQTVILRDQFIPEDTVSVGAPLQFCAPTSKNGLPILAPAEHLTLYSTQLEKDLVPHLILSTEDQFGPRTLEAVGTRWVLVPTQKLVGGLAFPDSLNHSRCYEVTGEPVDTTVSLDDQFGEDFVRVEHPHYFCNPVEKETLAGVISPILEPAVHLTCYDIFGPQRAKPQSFGVMNQFEQDTFTITTFQLLCVPAEKLAVDSV